MTQTLLDAGAVPRLLALMEDGAYSIQHRAIFALSNFTAGTTVQIQAVLDIGGLPKLLHVIHNEVQADLLREAIAAVSNMVGRHTTDQQKDYLVENGIIAALFVCLNKDDEKVLLCALDGVRGLCFTHVVAVAQYYASWPCKQGWTQAILVYRKFRVASRAAYLLELLAPHL